MKIWRTVFLSILILGFLVNSLSGQQVLQQGNFRIIYPRSADRRAIAVAKILQKYQTTCEQFFQVKLQHPFSVYLPDDFAAFQRLTGGALPEWS
ncbi:MAG: hypothetical protein WAN36_12915, partial [Calditrichia bacterium]